MAGISGKVPDVAIETSKQESWQAITQHSYLATGSYGVAIATFFAMMLFKI